MRLKASALTAAGIAVLAFAGSAQAKKSCPPGSKSHDYCEKPDKPDKPDGRGNDNRDDDYRHRNSYQDNPRYGKYYRQEQRGDSVLHRYPDGTCARVNR